MPFLLATHGGRYLQIGKSNALDEDCNYDMSRSPDDLRSAGALFDLNQGKLVTEEDQQVEFVENGKHRHALSVQTLSDGQCALRLEEDGRYISAGSDKLTLEREGPGPMAVFTLVGAKNH